MSLRDDLIAARALIDTPEKCATVRNPSAMSLTMAMNRVAKTDDQWIALSRAVQDQVPGQLYVDWSWNSSTDHADIMALFDRAIAAAEPANV